MTMSEPLVITLISTGGVVLTAWLTYLGVRLRSDRDRFKSMEARLGVVERQNVGLWAYCRALIDHIYRGHGAPPPEPPTKIQDLFD